MSPITLGIEIVLAIMLAACLYYFWRLDRRLAQLRTGQDGVLRAAAELAQATVQAETAVKALRLTAQEAGRDLQARINDAKGTAERLGLGSGRLRTASDVAPLRGRM